MGKFYGEIGYGESVETAPGVWIDKIITKRNYYGDVLRTTSKLRDSEHLNDNVVVDNRLSIIADPFAYEKFHAMRYIKWMGSLWKILSVEIQRPRLILTIGEIYNEQAT